MQEKLKNAQAMLEAAERNGDKGVAKLAAAAIKIYQQKLKDHEQTI